MASLSCSVIGWANQTAALGKFQNTEISIALRIFGCADFVSPLRRVPIISAQ